MIPGQGRDKQLVTWINIISLLLFRIFVKRKKNFLSIRPGLSCSPENILTIVSTSCSFPSVLVHGVKIEIFIVITPMRFKVTSGSNLRKVKI